MYRFWRIEDAEGRGPFKPGFTVEWRDTSGPAQPPPWVEAGISIAEFRRLIPAGKSANCGCRSQNELFSWFSRAERRRLVRLGYDVVEVAADEVLLETPTQVVFTRADGVIAHPPVPVPPAGSALDAHTPASSAQSFNRSFHEVRNAR